jgi:hypothetical protein
LWGHRGHRGSALAALENPEVSPVAVIASPVETASAGVKMKLKERSPLRFVATVLWPRR